MFYFMEDFEIPNYADDSTPLSHKSVSEELEISSSVLFTCLRNKYIGANTEKSHLLLSVCNTLTADIDSSISIEVNRTVFLMKKF